MIAAAAALPIAVAPVSLPTTDAVALNANAAELTESSPILIEMDTEDFIKIRESDYHSNWNMLVSTGLWYCSPTTCPMDLDIVYAEILANSGSYAPCLEAMFAAASNETLEYAENKFVISAELASLADAITNENKAQEYARVSVP